MATDKEIEPYKSVNPFMQFCEYKNFPVDVKYILIDLHLDLEPEIDPHTLFFSEARQR
mgnify:CR=1 FL=1